MQIHTILSLLFELSSLSDILLLITTLPRTPRCALPFRTARPPVSSLPRPHSRLDDLRFRIIAAGSGFVTGCGRAHASHVPTQQQRTTIAVAVVAAATVTICHCS